MVAADVGSMTAMGECVNERCNFAVNTNLRIHRATLRAHSLANSGLMCP